MTDWLLRHTSGLLDWLLVFIFVAALVCACQFMINFLKDPQDREGDDEY